MDYAEVIGQDVVKEWLRSMVDTAQLPHAIMLCGSSGCGKMALALALASQLLGESSMLRKLEHPDLHFTFPVIRPAGTPSEHKMVSDDFIQEWRDMLLESPYFSLNQWLERMNAANQQAIIGAGESDNLVHKLNMKSSQGGYKVSIIWLPERMNEECANKLLKLFEEPPAQTVFIMACEEPQALLETIRSRVQRIDIRRIDEQSIEQALIEQRGIDRPMAYAVARSANGSWLQAVEQLNADSENKYFFELFMQLMRYSWAVDIRSLKVWSNELASMGREKQKRFLVYTARMIRENFMCSFRNEELLYMTQEERDFSKKFSRFINGNNVIGISEDIDKAYKEIGQNANGKIVFFDMALQIMSLIKQK